MKALKRFVVAIFLLAPLILTLTAHSQSQTQTQQPQPPPADDKAAKEAAEEGIPVTNKLVIDRCVSCHKKDEKGRMTRISYERTTPEGWQQVIKRMIRLNGLTVTPEEARQIVKYLSNNHGLAPEEAKPAFYEAEKRVIDEKLPDESLRATCILCHSLGRVLSQRRSREEWELLGNMHIGLFPVVMFQGFYRFPQPPGAPPPTDPDQRHPVDKSIDYLAKNYPLTTPEWGAWRANMRAPKLQGRWLVSGSQIGRGQIYGEMIVEPTEIEDEFTTKLTLRYVEDGSTVSRSGRGIVYSGYSWRGRSTASDSKSPTESREAMFVSRDWATMEGRWFWGSYDEYGIDVSLRRINADPLIAGVNPVGLKTKSTGMQIHIYGANLPTDVKREEIDLGPGVTVKRVVNARNDDLTVEVDVADGAANGNRDISIRRYFAAKAIAVYDKVDYIKVIPDAGMARVGGINFPKQFQQFGAVAYNRGPDGKPQTADDVSLGTAEVEWSIDEFPATFDDDDKDFVGTLDSKGLFTPASDGPNPKRKKGVNNYGDVWVVATYKPKDDAKDAQRLKARSFLVVTVPLYVKWDQSEVSR
ncbi:MAG TPA: quinohemoprotein amine dehydrogenase subunit alpha [Blastocatellia bacterium]|nr:quinohemoprotein amine dehydrogenase subunit alpha [Blastocatellia bacterium]